MLKFVRRKTKRNMTNNKTHYAKRDDLKSEYSDKKIVYFIRVDNTNIYKIGHTRDMPTMKERFIIIRAYNHINLSIYGYIQCNNAIRLENEIHTLLKDHKIRGEWFNFNIDILNQYKIIQPNTT